MRSILLLPLASVLIACSAPNSSPDSDKETVQREKLETDLGLFSSLYHGEFSDFGLAETGTEKHYVYRRVELPAFGEHVAYVQQSYGTGDDPSLVYRQRIYSTYADHDRNEVVTRIYNFRDGEAEGVIDAHLNPSMLAEFSPDQMTVLPEGCEIFWYRDGNKFIGYQKPGVCVMQVPNTDLTMLLSDDLILSEDIYSTHTKGETEEGDPIFGDENPLVMHRAVVYDCTAEFEELNASRFRVHDLGGRAGLDALDDSAFITLKRHKVNDAMSDVSIELWSDEQNLVESSQGSAGTISLNSGEFSVACGVSEHPWSAGQ